MSYSTSSTSTNTNYGYYYQSTRGYYSPPSPLKVEAQLTKARKKKEKEAKELKMPTKPILFDPKDLRL